MHELADGDIRAFEGFLRFDGFRSNSLELSDEWAECWQEDAICIFRPHNDADESDNMIGFWDAGKILEKHCELNSDLNSAYFIIDFDSFIAICNFEIIKSFCKENDLIAKYELIG